MSAARFPGDPGPMSEWDPDQVIEANERHLEYMEEREALEAKGERMRVPPAHCEPYMCTGCSLALGAGIAARHNNRPYHPVCAERARKTA